MYVGPWAAFYYSERERKHFSAEKTEGRRLYRRPLSKRLLEKEPQTELHAASIVCAGQVQEVGRSKGRVDRVVLGVIEEIKVFPAKIEAGFFINGEPFEDAKVEVKTPRQIQSVAPDIAER